MWVYPGSLYASSVINLEVCHKEWMKEDLHLFLARTDFLCHGVLPRSSKAHFNHQIIWPDVHVHWCIFVHRIRKMKFRRLHNKYYARSVYSAVNLLLALDGSEAYQEAFMWTESGLTLGHVMSKTKPKRFCKYRCHQLVCKRCVLGWGFDVSCLCPTVVPAARATGTLPTCGSSAESKVPLLLPGEKNLKANPWVFVWALWQRCLRISQALFLQPKFSTAFPTSGLPPMRILVMVVLWKRGSWARSRKAVFWCHFEHSPKLLLTPVNCEERCLMVMHSSPHSAGAGCCRTVPLSPQSPSCHAGFLSSPSWRGHPLLL